jgi:integrase
VDAATRLRLRRAVDAARRKQLPALSALETIEKEVGVDLVTHDFRRSLASFLIVAARADEAAVTAVMGHANIETTRRIYAGDWREAEERNAIVLRQLAEAGIGQ